jgi:hypothetical protein
MVLTDDECPLAVPVVRTVSGLFFVLQSSVLRLILQLTFDIDVLEERDASTSSPISCSSSNQSRTRGETAALGGNSYQLVVTLREVSSVAYHQTRGLARGASPVVCTQSVHAMCVQCLR